MAGNSAKRPKRTTPPNEGYDYEVLIAILIAATFSNNKQVENYYIFPGLNEAHPFDDVVVKVLFKGKNTPYAFAIQLKHKGKGEKLKMKKYLEGYQKISNIGGFETIGNIALENIHLSYLCIKRVKPETRYKLISHNSISDPWKAAFPFQNCHKLSYKSSTNEADDEKLKGFLNNFYLYPDQSDTKKLKENIRILCKISDTTDILKYVEGFFKDDILWEGGLSKEIFETELLKIRLLEYILPPADITPLEDSSSQAWNELTLKYNVTIVEDEHNIKKHLYGCLAKMLGCLLKNTIDWEKCNKNDLDDSVINEFKKLCGAGKVKHWIVPPKTLKLLIIELWKCDKIPLILESDADLSFLKSYAHLNKSCIIITTSLVNQMTLLCASKWGQKNLVKLLLEKGTDVNSIIIDDKTLFMFASEFCALDTIKLLLSKGANVNSKTATGKTPLIGANINHATTQGETELMSASVSGNSQTVRLLLDNKLIGRTIPSLARRNNLVTHREEIPLSVFTHASDILGHRLLKDIFISLHGRKPISLYDIVNWHEDFAMTLSCSQILHLMKRREAYLSEDCLSCNHNIVFLIEDQFSSTEYDIDDILNNIDGNTTIRCRSSEKIRGYREQIKKDPQLQDYETYICVKLPENKNITLLEGKKSLLRDYFVDQDEERVYYPDFCIPIPILGNNLRSIQEDYIPRFLCTAIISKALFDSNTKGICFCSGDFAGSEVSNDLINVSVEKICFNNENSFIKVNSKDVDEYWKNASNLDCPLLHIDIEDTEMHLCKSKKWQGLTNHISYSSQSISEEQLLQKITKGITIITGGPGIGKSRLLRSLFENCGTDNYILLYNLADYEKDKNKILSANSSLDFIFNKFRGTRYSKFLSGVLKNTERLVVLLDSFDQVMQKCKEKILEFIRNLAASNVKIIIASRLIANCVLMDNFEVQIFRIDLLRADDRRKCIKNCNLSEADLTAIPIVFTGNPLYCKFLKIISETNVTLAHVSKLTLFKRIMCIKLDQYFESNFSSDLDKEYCLRPVREIHAKLALVKILGADVVKTLLTWNYEEKLYHNLKLGIVLSIDEGCPTFVDEAFAEYLTANWITINIKENSAKDIYLKILEQNKHWVLNILCEHLKLHRAIIDQNLEHIEMYAKKKLYFEEFDDLGRTALHIAAARFKYSSPVWYESPIGILTNNMYILQIDFTTCDNLMQWNWIQHLNNGDVIHLMPCYDLSTSVMEVYVNDIVAKLRIGVFGLHSDNNLTNQIRNVYEKAIEACRIDLIRNLFLLDYTRSSGVPEVDTLNLKGCSLRGFTALHAACIFNNLEAVRKLLNMSYDINIGETPLIFDSEENNSDIVKILFEAKADIDSTTEHGETALMFAVKFGNSNIVKILLDKGANVSSKTAAGKTPLMFASEKGYSNIIKILEGGAHAAAQL